MFGVGIRQNLGKFDVSRYLLSGLNLCNLRFALIPRLGGWIWRFSNFGLVFDFVVCWIAVLYWMVLDWYKVESWCFWF